MFQGVLELGKLLFQECHLLLEGNDFVCPLQHLSQYSVSPESDDLLREISDLHALGRLDLSSIHGFLSQDHPEKGGLSRSIGADEAEAIPDADLKGAVLK